MADAASETAAPPAEAPSAAAALLTRIDTAIGWVTEISAAILVLVEIVILFAGVLARYVFDRPFTWSDELATILFLWLAMLGSVVALRRSRFCAAILCHPSAAAGPLTQITRPLDVTPRLRDIRAVQY